MDTFNDIGYDEEIHSDLLEAHKTSAARGPSVERVVHLVRTSWEKVVHGQHGEALVTSFYDVFLKDPANAVLFEEVDMVRQSQKLADVLNLVVSNLLDHRKLRGAVRALAKRHMNYGVKPSHFVGVGPALIAALKSNLEPHGHWNEEIEAAWGAAYGLIQNSMLNVYSEWADMEESDSAGGSHRKGSLSMLSQLDIDLLTKQQLLDREFEGIDKMRFSAPIREFLDAVQKVDWSPSSMNDLRRKFLTPAHEVYKFLVPFRAQLVSKDRIKTWLAAVKHVRKVAPKKHTEITNVFQKCLRKASRSVLRVRAVSASIQMEKSAALYLIIDVSSNSQRLSQTTTWNGSSDFVSFPDLIEEDKFHFTFKLVKGKRRSVALTQFQTTIPWSSLIGDGPAEGYSEVLSGKDETMFVHFKITFSPEEEMLYLRSLHSIVIEEVTLRLNHASSSESSSIDLSVDEEDDNSSSAVRTPSPRLVLRHERPSGGESEADSAVVMGYATDIDGTLLSDVDDDGGSMFPYSGSESTSTFDSMRRKGSQGAFDLNERFQVAMDRITNNPNDADAWTAILNVALEFESKAKKIAELLVAERSLPVADRTIPPSSTAGGRLGGEKYIHGGIFYKFASPDGRIVATYSAAAKVAGNEMKGARCYSGSSVRGLCLPLMCIVDLSGFRVIAQALLPINKSSLVCGSDDGSTRVRSSDSRAVRLLAQAAGVLNLKPHYVRSTLTWAAADVECHFAGGRHYVIDLSRTLPPESTKNIFTECLRPEFVARHAVPLSPDVFSGFRGEGFELDCAEVIQARLRLVRNIIPATAHKLDLYFSSEWDSGGGAQQLEMLRQLSGRLHSEGVNVRHMGLVYNVGRGQQLRLAITLEVMARVIKRLIRNSWRDLFNSGQVSVGVVEQYDAAVQVLQLIQTEEFWVHTLNPMAKKRFSFEYQAIVPGLRQDSSLSSSSSSPTGSPLQRTKATDSERKKSLTGLLKRSGSRTSRGRSQSSPPAYVPSAPKSAYALIHSRPAYCALLWLRAAQQLGVTFASHFQGFLNDARLSQRQQQQQSQQQQQQGGGDQHLFTHLSFVSTLSIADISPVSKSLCLHERSEAMLRFFECKKMPGTVRLPYLQHAAHAFRMCFRENPISSVPFILAAAECLQMLPEDQRDNEEILRLFDSALAVDGKSCDTLRARAHFLHVIGQPCEAQYFWLRALVFAATDEQTRVIAAEYDDFLKVSSLEEQRKLLRNVITMSPRDLNQLKKKKTQHKLKRSGNRSRSASKNHRPRSLRGNPQRAHTVGKVNSIQQLRQEQQQNQKGELQMPSSVQQQQQQPKLHRKSGESPIIPRSEPASRREKSHAMRFTRTGRARSASVESINSRRSEGRSLTPPKISLDDLIKQVSK